MKSLEQEIKSYLKNHQLSFSDNTGSFKLLDYSISGLQQKKVHLDAKEKRQDINFNNWPITKEEEPYKFIIDDLAVRKVFAYAPYSGVVIRNNLTENHYWFSAIDLAIMPKQRVNRQISGGTFKGKWIIDLRNGFEGTLQEVFSTISKTDIKHVCTEYLPCYGQYIGEDVGSGGQLRTQEHRHIDVSSTR
jgi:hypothetical protein